MPGWETSGDHLIPVQHMRPGDHAFVSYDNDEARWDVVTAFVRLGLARGEKVLVFPSPRLSREEVLARLDFLGRSTVVARRQGQLVIGSILGLIGPDVPFTAERQIGRMQQETDRARREGFAALRCFVDMQWVPAAGADVRGVMHRETHADELFEGRPYSEICAYDRRCFDHEVLTAMERAHPRALLERLGELHADPGPDGTLRVVGEADARSLDSFTTALEIALARTAHTRRLTVDLTQVHFLSVGCATTLLILAAQALGHELIEVRCGRLLARTLQRLGAGSVPRLALTEVARPC